MSIVKLPKGDELRTLAVLDLRKLVVVPSIQIYSPIGLSPSRIIACPRGTV
jgi:hypothetical protein